MHFPSILQSEKDALAVDFSTLLSAKEIPTFGKKTGSLDLFKHECAEDLLHRREPVGIYTLGNEIFYFVDEDHKECPDKNIWRYGIKTKISSVYMVKHRAVTPAA